MIRAYTIHINICSVKSWEDPSLSHVATSIFCWVIAFWKSGRCIVIIRRIGMHGMRKNTRDAPKNAEVINTVWDQSGKALTYTEYVAGPKFIVGRFRRMSESFGINGRWTIFREKVWISVTIKQKNLVFLRPESVILGN